MRTEPNLKYVRSEPEPKFQFRSENAHSYLLVRGPIVEKFKNISGHLKYLYLLLQQNTN